MGDLIAGLAGEQLPPSLFSETWPRIRRVVIDSRLATDGCLFVALRGERRDGHDFLAAAIAKGAVAIIAQRLPGLVIDQSIDVEGVSIYKVDGVYCLVVKDSLVGLQRTAAYWRRRHSARVVGVTGSIGKTTSKEAIAAVLSGHYCTLKSEGNYNNEIGLPLTLLHLTSAHERVVLEMGMYDVGEIAHLAEIAAPQVGVVTNVGPTHLERLGTMARIAQAKSELPRALPPADEGGVAILNADDEQVRAMAELTRARVFTYGLTPKANLWADNVESEGLTGIRLQFHDGQRTLNARLPFLGRHAAATALSAAAVGLQEGLTWEEILTGLSDSSAQVRLVAVPGLAGSIILDDTYNASPASCIAALDLLNELQGRKIAVLGDMYELGVYTEEGHEIVGRHARQTAHILVAVGQLGRQIGKEALKAGMPADTVHLVASNTEAVDLLQSIIKAGAGEDRILVKGSRGMEMEEIVAALAQPTPSPTKQQKDAKL